MALSLVSPVRVSKPVASCTPVTLPVRSVRSSRTSTHRVLRKLGIRRFFDMATTPPGEKGLGVEANLGARPFARGPPRQRGEAPGNRGRYPIAPLEGKIPHPLVQLSCRLVESLNNMIPRSLQCISFAIGCIDLRCEQ